MRFTRKRNGEISRLILLVNVTNLHSTANHNVISTGAKRNGEISVCQLPLSYQYYVYILRNHSGTLYIGVTNDLFRRVYEHKNKLIQGFTAKYNINQLVYFETFPDIHAAIAREKQIKKWNRSKKIALIRSLNPEWKDLSEGWFDDFEL